MATKHQVGNQIEVELGDNYAILRHGGDAATDAVEIWVHSLAEAKELCMAADVIAQGTKWSGDKKLMDERNANCGWPWCDACQSYHHRQNPTCKMILDEFADFPSIDGGQQ